jgi:hypothetical protein
MGFPPTKFDERAFLDNLLLNEDRERYRSMTLEQQRLVRFAYNYGYLTRQDEVKKEG